MPFFKTTHNILKIRWEDELFNENWMDSNFLINPESEPWDYSRELQIEDIDIWEVIYEASEGFGVYAAWNPYAEFYMILENYQVSTHYGVGAQKFVKDFFYRYNIPFAQHKIWVDPDDMWLYSSIPTP